MVEDEVDGQLRLSWRDGAGTVVVEHYCFDGMAHGLPTEENLGGFELAVGISSTLRIAKSWGLLRQTGDTEESLRKNHGKTGFHTSDLWS